MLHSSHFPLHHHHIPLPLIHHNHNHNHHHHYNPLLHHILYKPTKTTLHIVSAVPPPWVISHLVSTGTTFIDLPAPFSLTAANVDASSTVQVASSVLITGATAAFFFRSTLARVKRAKQLKFRSSGVNKSLDSLRAIQSKPIKAKNPPKPDQALLGAIIAGVMALVLYKMTTTIETALSHQTISNNFSVRQVTITIRTMISGLCYLATFIYGFNSIGLLLYSGQLSIEGFMEKETDTKISESLTSSTNNNNELSTIKEDQSPNKSQ